MTLKRVVFNVIKGTMVNDVRGRAAASMNYP